MASKPEIRGQVAQGLAKLVEGSRIGETARGEQLTAAGFEQLLEVALGRQLAENKVEPSRLSEAAFAYATGQSDRNPRCTGDLLRDVLGDDADLVRRA